MRPLGKLHLALVHWPVLNRQGERINTATTNLDIHDIGRAGRSYGVAATWLVQPLDRQRAMIERILAHWTTGAGAELHPDRPGALADVRAVPTLADIAAAVGPDAVWVATTAQPQRPTIAPAALAGRLAGPDAPPHVLVFGTGWGLAPEVLAAADEVLDPIDVGDYNHLSVRSAVAIYLDRIWSGAVR